MRAKCFSLRLAAFLRIHVKKVFIYKKKSSDCLFSRCLINNGQCKRHYEEEQSESHDKGTCRLLYSWDRALNISGLIFER